MQGSLKLQDLRGLIPCSVPINRSPSGTGLVGHDAVVIVVLAVSHRRCEENFSTTPQQALFRSLLLLSVSVLSFWELSLCTERVKGKL